MIYDVLSIYFDEAILIKGLDNISYIFHAECG
jgi:hypothetical protein